METQVWEKLGDLRTLPLVMGGYFDSRFKILYCYFSFHFLRVGQENTMCPLNVAFQIIF